MTVIYEDDSEATNAPIYKPIAQRPSMLKVDLSIQWYIHICLLCPVNYLLLPAHLRKLFAIIKLELLVVQNLKYAPLIGWNTTATVYWKRGGGGGGGWEVH